MKRLASQQIRHKRTGRTVLAAVLVAWLTTALQPCLMAMEMPVEMATTEMAAAMDDVHQSSHHAESSGGHFCAHCPPATIVDQASCQDVAPMDCDESVSYQTDSRNAKPVPKVSSDSLPCVLPIADLTAGKHGAGVRLFDPDAAPLSAGPSLSILYCRFLK